GFRDVADWANRNRPSHAATGEGAVKKIPLILFVVLIALAQGSSSYLTSNGRRQASYARYIRHSSYNRMKLQRKLSHSPKIQPPRMESEPTVATSTAPESVPGGANPATSEN